MICLEKVSLRYATASGSILALDAIDLRLPQGAMVILTGPSGAGKSSLLRLLFFELRPTSGRVMIFGQDCALVDRYESARMRRRMGIIFQEFRLLDHLTLFDNVALPLRVAGKEESTYQQDVREILQWVGLGRHVYSFPPVLSGGEKQRAAIARAVIASPELIIADEPTASVDSALAARLMLLFSEMNRQGRTILLATHDLALIESQQVPVLYLAEGRLSPWGQN